VQTECPYRNHNRNHNPTLHEVTSVALSYSLTHSLTRSHTHTHKHTHTHTHTHKHTHTHTHTHTHENFVRKETSESAIDNQPLNNIDLTQKVWPTREFVFTCIPQSFELPGIHSKKNVLLTDTCLYIVKASYPLKEANVIAAQTIVTKMAILSAV